MKTMCDPKTVTHRKNNYKCLIDVTLYSQEFSDIITYLVINNSDRIYSETVKFKLNNMEIIGGIGKDVSSSKDNIRGLNEGSIEVVSAERKVTFTL